MMTLTAWLVCIVEAIIVQKDSLQTMIVVLDMQMYSELQIGGLIQDVMKQPI